VHAVVRDMQELAREVNLKNYREVFNEAVSNKDTMHSLFDLGYVSLLERAHVEQLYHRTLQRIAKVIEQLDYVPEELEALPKRLADQYVVNFSLFQGMPDHWAIQQLFPIVPLHRLHEPPLREATLVDISCDSDGKIQKFIDLRDVRSTLPVHDLQPGRPYYLGAFLTGAYQDVLANTHNLFGRMNEAHVRLDGGRLAPGAVRQRPEGAQGDREHGLRDRRAARLAAGRDPRGRALRRQAERRRQARDDRALRRGAGGVHLPRAGLGPRRRVVVARPVDNGRARRHPGYATGGNRWRASSATFGRFRRP
jgi:hypothetical protein